MTIIAKRIAPIPNVTDGLETQDRHGDHWICYRDSGSWWALKLGTTENMDLGSDAKEAARALQDLGHTRA